MHRRIDPAGALRAALALFLIAGCGGDGNGGNNPPDDDLVLAKAAPSGDDQLGTVGEELTDPLRVLVTLNGAPEPNRQVTWTALDGSVTPAGSMTGADGIASTAWTLGTTAGGQQARATLAGATGSPLTFDADAGAGPAAALAKVSGDDQGGRVGTPAGSPIIVRVNDEFGNPVAGTLVTFAVTGGSASLGDLTDNTGANGEAQTTFSFGATPGTISLTATVAGLTGSPQTFEAESGQVLVANNQYQPADLTVPAGTTVRWAWATTATPHNINPVGGTEPAASGTSAAPFAFSHTFNTPGVYNYECTVHVGMAGTITVN